MNSDTTKKHTFVKILFGVLILIIGFAVLVFTATQQRPAYGTPTLSPEEVQGTSIALAQTAISMTRVAIPTSTLLPSPTFAFIGDGSGTPFQFHTPLPGLTQTGMTQVALGTPGQLCDDMFFDPDTVDITVLEGSQMKPGQDFVKTWKIKNVGICPWDAGYGLIYAGYADKMNGEPVSLGTLVAVGQEVDVSVKFKAPTIDGEYISAWQMANAKGVPFGKAISVKIVVKAGEVGTSTPEETSAPTQMPNPTQTLQAVFNDINSQFKNSFKANIAFNKPKQMKKGETTSVELLLEYADKALSTQTVPLATQLVERGGFATSTADPDMLIAPSGASVTIETSQIEITPRMKAVLISQDSEAFTVLAMHDNAEQIVSTLENTTWRWSITAKKEGQHTLELVIYQLVKYDGTEHWPEVATYKADIVVEVTAADWLKSLDWYWIAGFIVTLVGAIVSIWKWLDERKKKAAESKPSAPVRRKK